MSESKPNPSPEPEISESEADAAASPEIVLGPDTEQVFEAAAEVDPKVAELEAEVARLKDELLRAVAETENVRRRLQQDLNTKIRYAHADFARDLLAVSDNLGRAMASVPQEARAGDEMLNTLFVGVELTRNELVSVFARYGVAEVEAMGRIMDPNLHQAMFEVEDANVPVGTIVQVVAPGYVIHDRLLRAAMVGVAKGGPKPEAPSEDEGQKTKSGPSGAYEKAQGTAGSGGTVDTEL